MMNKNKDFFINDVEVEELTLEEKTPSASTVLYKDTSKRGAHSSAEMTEFAVTSGEEELMLASAETYDGVSLEDVRKKTAATSYFYREGGTMTAVSTASPDTAESGFLQTKTILVGDASASPDPNYLRIGYGAENAAYESYMKLSLPDIEDGVVENAALILTVADSTGSCSCEDYRVMLIEEGNFDPAAVSGTSRPVCTGDPCAVFAHGGALGNELRLDLTEAIRERYAEGQGSLGLAILPSSTVCAGHSMLFGAEGASAGSPRLEVTYTSPTLFTPRSMQRSFANGRAGSSTVNLHTGTMHHVHTDITLEGVRMPLALSHVYSSHARKTDQQSTAVNPYGNGWHLSLSQTLTKMAEGNVLAIYCDEQGEEHVFTQKADGSITDTQGAGLTLRNLSSPYTIVEDLHGNTLHFNSAGRLIYIGDAYNNYTHISYDGNGRISAVTDDASRKAFLSYNATTGLLSEISYTAVPTEATVANTEDPAFRTLRFAYSTDGDLTTVTYEDGTTRTDFSYAVAVTPEVDEVYASLFGEAFSSKNPNGSMVELRKGKSLPTYFELTPYTLLNYREGTTNATEWSGERSVTLRRMGNTCDIGEVGKPHTYYQLDEYGQILYTYNNTAEENAEERHLTMRPSSALYAYEVAPDPHSLDGTGNTERRTLHVSKGGEVYALVSGGPVLQNNELLLDPFFAEFANDVTWRRVSGAEYFSASDTPELTLDGSTAYTEVCIARGGLPSTAAPSVMEQTRSLTGVTLTENTLVLSVWAKILGNAYTPPTVTLHAVLCDTLGREHLYSCSLGAKHTAWQLAMLAIPIPTDAAPVSCTVSISVGGNGTVRLAYPTLTNETGLCTTYSDCHCAPLTIFGEQVTAAYAVTESDGKSSSVTEYDSRWNPLKTAYTDAAGHVFTTLSAYDPMTHALLKTEDHRGTVTEYTYHTAGACIQQKTYPKGTPTLFTLNRTEYDAVNDRFSVSYDEVGTPLPAPTSYDAYGRPTAYSAYGMNVTCAYDLCNRLTQYQATADEKNRTVLHTYEGDRQVKVTANGLYYHTRKILPEGETASREDEREIVYIGTGGGENATEIAYGGEPEWDLVKENTEGTESTETPTEGESTTAEDVKTVEYDTCGCLTYRLDKLEKRCYTYYYNRRHQPIYEKIEAWNEETNTAGDLICYRRFTYSATGLLTSSYSSLTGKTTQYGYETNAGGYPYPDAALLSVTEGNATSTVEIDGLGRTTRKTVKHGLTQVVKNEIAYATGTSGSFAGAATARPTSYATTDATGTKTDSFTYDARGNITHIYRGGELLVRYSYDKFGQLIREDNAELYTTQLFIYDDHGNRRFKEQYHYTLGDYCNSNNRFFYQDYHYKTAGWRDQLDQYGDHSETETKYYNYGYDNLGNPTLKDPTADDSAWAGTLLVQYKPGHTIYIYNDQGVRISKSGSEGTTTYTVEGATILAEKRVLDSVETLISYHYGSDGIFGFTYNGTEYYYGKNLFGDITDIYDASGVKVAHYAYDAWGNHTVYNGSGMPMYSLDFIGVINPFRYRGYYYDIESGYYYLQSRYYDPTKGRFLNADSLGYLGADGELRGYNLYTYCGNNPVMNVDPSGHLIIGMFIAFGIGAILGGIYGGISAAGNGQDVLSGIIIGAIVGGLTGFITEALSIPFMLIGTFLVGAGGDIASQMILDGKSFYDVNFLSAAWAGVTNAGLALVGKGFSDVGKMVQLNTVENIVFGTLTNSPILALGMAINMGISQHSNTYTVNDLRRNLFNSRTNTEALKYGF